MNERLLKLCLSNLHQKGLRDDVHGGRGDYVELMKEQIIVPLKPKFNMTLPEK